MVLRLPCAEDGPLNLFRPGPFLDDRRDQIETFLIGKPADDADEWCFARLW